MGWMIRDAKWLFDQHHHEQDHPDSPVKSVGLGLFDQQFAQSGSLFLCQLGCGPGGG